MNDEPMANTSVFEEFENYAFNKSPTTFFSINEDPNEIQPSQEHLDVLLKIFGHKSFRPMQWKIIHSIINEKKDNCVIMATGYGKSLCFQYPSVYVGGVTIVISPLISLMEDQVTSLTVSGIDACFLGQAQSNSRIIMDEILENKYCLVYMTPEFSMSDQGRNFLSKMNEKLFLTLIAIDEAHCISSWGHDFRFAYRELGCLRNLLPGIPILAVTATATPNVQKDIIKSLDLNDPQVLCSGFDRPNLYFHVYLKEKNVGVYAHLRKLMVKREEIFKFNGCTIIYCLTRKQSEEISENLKFEGIKCLPYHAGLSIKQRKETYQKFVRDEIDTIVATVAFGMGIDKPDVRNVVHYGASNSIEAYYQEVGRAGRDGLPANCVMFFNESDFTIHDKLRNANYGGQVAKERKKKMVDDMRRFLNTRDCRRKFILDYFHDSKGSKMLSNCCDNCSRKRREGISDHEKYVGLNQAGLYDFTQDSHIFLSAVVAMGEKFGLVSYTLFLRGSNNAKLKGKFQGHILHGSGKYQTENWWKGLAALLLRENFIERVEQSKFVSVIELTSKGRKFLQDVANGRNPPKLMFAPPPELVKLLKIKPQEKSQWITTKIIPDLKGASTSRETSINTESNADLDQRMKLYKLLLDKRSNLVKLHDCLPYMVASNTALMELARNKPLTLTQLKDCKLDGFSELKINRFGEDFLQTIRKFCNKSGDFKRSIRDILVEHPLTNWKISDFSEHLYKLFQSGLTINEIANKKGIIPTTVLNHLVDCIKVGYPIKMANLGVDKKCQEIIEQAAKQVKNGYDTLSAIKNECPSDITYEQIKIVAAHAHVRKHLKNLGIPYEDFEDSVLENVQENEKLGKLVDLCMEMLNDDDNADSDTTIILDGDSPVSKKAKIDQGNIDVILGSPPRINSELNEMSEVKNEFHSKENVKIESNCGGGSHVEKKKIEVKSNKKLPPWLTKKKIQVK